eukprot:4060363-Pyramimonas_sp.AAC.1
MSFQRNSAPRGLGGLGESAEAPAAKVAPSSASAGPFKYRKGRGRRPSTPIHGARRSIFDPAHH